MDKRFDDTNMNATTAGATTVFSGGEFPVVTPTDSADDHYLAFKLSTGTHPSTGVLRVFVLNVSFGATT